MTFLIVCLIICITVGVPIFLLVFAIKQDYFNTCGGSDGSSEIFLTFKDFIKFYNLNPDRYEITYDYNEELSSLNIKEEYEGFNRFCRPSVGFRNKYKVKFKLFSYIRFYYWNKHRQKVKKKCKHNEDMRGMLKLVQKDIDSIRKQAEKEIREAEKITNEIGRRL